jgi:RNA polymerase sigma factor (TIGR02999 family)
VRVPHDRFSTAEFLPSYTPKCDSHDESGSRLLNPVFSAWSRLSLRLLTLFSVAFEVVQMSGAAGSSSEDSGVDFPTAQITAALDQLRYGDQESTDRLLPLVYNELRQLANRLLRRERANHTLQATALVHETFLRMSAHSEQVWQDRAHFIGFAAHSMRQILVDHARTSRAAKRVPAESKISLDQNVMSLQEKSAELIALDDALNQLAGLSERQSSIVELRFFAGLTVEETAEVLGVSEKTVKRDWSLARAWLYAELRRK